MFYLWLEELGLAGVMDFKGVLVKVNCFAFKVFLISMILNPLTILVKHVICAEMQQFLNCCNCVWFESGK